MTPVRVRILAGSLVPGAGSHVYNRELARRLALRGHTVSVVCFERGLLPESVSQVEIPHHGFGAYPVVWRIAPWLEWLHAREQFARASMPPADVVVAAEHLLITAHAKRFPDTPILYLPHSLRVRDEIAGYGLAPAQSRATLALYTRLQRWSLRHSNVVVRFSRAACVLLEQEYPDIVSIKFAVNPPGVDAAEGPTLVATQSGPLRLLCVGRLIPGKRVDMLLRTLATVSRSDWTLDVIGDGSERAALQALAALLGLGERVKFLGFRPDPTPWYRNSDLLVMTSRSESYGLVLIEGMSHGVPCLALKSDGITTWNVNDEIIDHGRTGLLAEGESGLRQALELVISDRSVLTAMGQAAYAHVVRQHTWDAHIERYEALFTDLRQPVRISP